MVVAVYPGTFDPLTRGHEDLVRRASGLFDTLVVGVADSQNKSASANVDFSAAQIAVVRRGGGAVGVSSVSHDNDGYGLPNNLRFSVGTLAYNTIHDVTISNVRVGGVVRSYSYWFRVVQ